MIMDCTATGIMTPLKGRFERLTSEDVDYSFWFVNKAKEKIVDPTNFIVTFFVKNRMAEIVCRKDWGNPPDNCKIGTDGLVTFFLPKDTFSAGRLLYRIDWTIAYPSFPPADTFTWQDVYDTGYIYIDKV